MIPMSFETFDALIKLGMKNYEKDAEICSKVTKLFEDGEVIGLNHILDNLTELLTELFDDRGEFIDFYVYECLLSYDNAPKFITIDDNEVEVTSRVIYDILVQNIKDKLQ